MKFCWSERCFAAQHDLVTVTGELKGCYHWCQSGCRDPSPSRPPASLAGRPRDRRHTLCVCLGRCQTGPSPLWAALTSARQEAADVKGEFTSAWPVALIHMFIFPSLHRCDSPLSCHLTGTEHWALHIHMEFDVKRSSPIAFTIH